MSSGDQADPLLVLSGAFESEISDISERHDDYLGRALEPDPGGLTVRALQRMILQLYGQKDAARGDAATFLWLAEEFGELASALRAGTDEELALEMADVLAWLVTLANVRGIDLEAAVLRKYGRACPGCGSVPCVCDPSVKP